jgi:hypothetical protein
VVNNEGTPKLKEKMMSGKMLRKNYMLKIVLLCALLFLNCATCYAVEIDSGKYSPTVSPDSVVDVWESIGDLSLKSFLTSDSQNGDYDALYLDSINDITKQIIFLRDLNANNATDRIVVLAKVRLDQFAGDTSLGGCAILVEDNINSNALLITPTYISLSRSGEVYFMDTTDNFHMYKIIAQGSQFQVYIDNDPNPVLDGSWSQQFYPARNIVSFGDHSGGASSKAAWASVEYSVFQD